MKFHLAELELYPYTTQRIAEERRAELLRDAEAWRLAHPVQIQTTKRARSGIRLLPWRRARIRPACPPVLRDAPRLQSQHGHDAPQRDSHGSGPTTSKRTRPRVGLPAGLPFSLAGEADGLCFISGMPALDPDGRFVPGTFEEETDLAWHNVAAIAEAAGCAIDDIVYVQCVLSDIDDYGDLNAWWRRQFPDRSTAPARFTFQAGALPFGARIEIQAIAARGS